MVKLNTVLLNQAGNGISKTLMEILVCPLSKQPLRFCEKSNSLISDSVGVSYPIIDRIPCLVPTDAKIIDTDETSNADGFDNSTIKNNDPK